MKATGIVRRIDDLGRVVIPKEIRRTLRIREGEPMEIFTDSGGSVIFKKYSPAAEQGLMAEQLCESVYRTAGRAIAICDRDGVAKHNIMEIGEERRHGYAWAGDWAKKLLPAYDKYGYITGTITATVVNTSAKTADGKTLEKNATFTIGQ